MKSSILGIRSFSRAFGFTASSSPRFESQIYEVPFIPYAFSIFFGYVVVMKSPFEPEDTSSPNSRYVTFISLSNTRWDLSLLIIRIYLSA